MAGPRDPGVTFFLFLQLPMDLIGPTNLCQLGQLFGAPSLRKNPAAIEPTTRADSTEPKTKTSFRSLKGHPQFEAYAQYLEEATFFFLDGKR